MADAAGVPVELANELWRLLGFPITGPDERAFTAADVEALRLSANLVSLGILSPDRQAALVRTWGRSFARLAEWQTALLAELAGERPGDTVEELATLAAGVVPDLEALQSYIWRRHAASAAIRLLTGAETPGSAAMTVCFIDIVGYTARSRSLTDEELVGWVERFEDICTGLVVDHGGRVIKTLGDAVLFVCDDPVGAAEVALTATELGGGEDGFPEVRAGLAYGQVVARLGDVFGPTVNVASRLTNVARPGTVVVDERAAEELTGGYSLVRLRRTSVKGYSRLQPYALRRVR